MKSTLAVRKFPAIPTTKLTSLRFSRKLCSNELIDIAYRKPISPRLKLKLTVFVIDHQPGLSTGLGLGQGEIKIKIGTSTKLKLKVKVILSVPTYYEYYY